MKSMRVTQRLIAATVLVALSCALSACGTNGSFDPTDVMDFLDTKKKMPGDRKPVFPDGVPGVEQGVPKELYKGAQQQDQLPPPVSAAPPVAPEPKSKKGGTKTASRTPSRGEAVDAPEPAPGAPGTSATPVDQAPSADDGTAAAAPPPASKRTAKRRSITAPPPDAQPAPQSQSQSRSAAAPAPQAQSGDAFPAPLPSGGFQR